MVTGGTSGPDPITTQSRSSHGAVTERSRSLSYTPETHPQADKETLHLIEKIDLRAILVKTNSSKTHHTEYYEVINAITDKNKTKQKHVGETTRVRIVASIRNIYIYIYVQNKLGFTCHMSHPRTLPLLTPLVCKDKKIQQDNFLQFLSQHCYF